MTLPGGITNGFLPKGVPEVTDEGIPGIMPGNSGIIEGILENYLMYVCGVIP